MAFFHTKDNLALFYAGIQAASCKAAVVFVHGLGEHIGRYETVFRALSDQGYSCYGFDQRGFGQSEGERGHVDSFSRYADDLEKFIAEVETKEPGKPVFLFGHSMGSIIVLSYALKQPSAIKGLLIFSCPLKLAQWTANLGGFFSTALASIAPALKLPNFIDPEGLSDDPEVIKAFMTDPLNYDKVSASWLREFKRARAAVWLDAHRIMMPILISHGSQDRIADVAGAQCLHDRVGSADKSIIIYDGYKHELLNHLAEERALVLRRTVEWLDEHCGNRGTVIG